MRRLLSCRRGAAAAEMAMVTPLLLILLFGSVELGAYFWNEHIVQKSVREGARYAARQPVTGFVCPGATIEAATADRIKAVTRTGLLTGGTTRVRDWDDAEISISVECQATPTGIYAAGIYTNLPGGARTVTVRATVPYPSLFGNSFGLDASGLQVRAKSHAAVFGI